LFFVHLQFESFQTERKTKNSFITPGHFIVAYSLQKCLLPYALGEGSSRQFRQSRAHNFRRLARKHTLYCVAAKSPIRSGLFGCLWLGGCQNSSKLSHTSPTPVQKHLSSQFDRNKSLVSGRVRGRITKLLRWLSKATIPNDS
jgi:hypothetical protein